jgi:hypothetical protein
MSKEFRNENRGDPTGASTMPMTLSTGVYITPVFWERLWRLSGIHA